VLDVNLPGEDGFSICLRLRNVNRLPVVMVTSRGEDMDRILGIELGADDYLVKPFIPRELLARIGAVLRRSAPEQEARKRLRSIALRVRPRIAYTPIVATEWRQGDLDKRGVRDAANPLSATGPCIFARSTKVGGDHGPKRRHHREPPAQRSKKTRATQS